MRKGDGSLVFFTVLSQWSVGIVVCLAGLTLFTGEATVVAVAALHPANPVLLALFLVALATMVSFLHLGNPVNAPKAARNLATSWLSREILAIGLYSISLLAALAFGSNPGILLLCAVTGLFLVWAMAGVYRIPTIPAWNSGFTPLGFLLAALGMGLVSCLLLHALGAISPGAGGLLSASLMAVLALEMITALLNRQRLARLDTGIDDPALHHGAARSRFLARMAVLLLAILVMSLLVMGSGASTPVSLLLLALVLLQAVLGRALFYGSYFRIGL